MVPSTSLRIAVIIPAHDAADVIGRALSSVARQSRRPDEVIVVDDGSRDGTATAVRAWLEEGSLPLRMIHQENRGPGAARNAALEASRSELILPLDADDELLPGGIRALAAGFRAWPDLVLCFGDAERRHTSGDRGGSYLTGKPVARLPWEPPTEPSDETPLRLLGEGVFESLLGGSYIANGAALFSREAALEAGGWDPTFATVEDRDFWLRMSRRGPFAYTPAEVARISYHQDNLMRRTRRASHALDALGVLVKTLRDAERLKLSPTQVSAVRTAVGEAADRAVRTGSETGIAAFARAVSSALNAGWKPRPADIRHLLRLARTALDPRHHAAPRANATEAVSWTSPRK